MATLRKGCLPVPKLADEPSESDCTVQGRPICQRPLPLIRRRASPGSDHRFGLASGHGTAEHGFTTRTVVREKVTEDLRDSEPMWMGKMT